MKITSHRDEANEEPKFHLVWKYHKIGHGGSVFLSGDDEEEEGHGGVRRGHEEEEIFGFFPRLETVHAVQGVGPTLLSHLVVIFILGQAIQLGQQKMIKLKERK